MDSIIEISEEDESFSVFSNNSAQINYLYERIYLIYHIFRLIVDLIIFILCLKDNAKLYAEFYF
jgi:hypothetical protein